MFGVAVKCLWFSRVVSTHTHKPNTDHWSEQVELKIDLDEAELQLLATWLGERGTSPVSHQSKRVSHFTAYFSLSPNEMVTFCFVTVPPLIAQ